MALCEGFDGDCQESFASSDHPTRLRVWLVTAVLVEMLERGVAFRPDVIEGRFVIETRFQGRTWEVVVEPDEVEHLLVVVTAYGVEP